jgi:hypothetical protein
VSLVGNEYALMSAKVPSSSDAEAAAVHTAPVISLDLKMPGGIKDFAEYEHIAKHQAAVALSCTTADILLTMPRQVLAAQQLTVNVSAFQPGSTAENLQTKTLLEKIYSTSLLIRAGIVLCTVLLSVLLFCIYQSLAWWNASRAINNDISSLKLNLKKAQNELLASDGVPKLKMSPLETAKFLMSKDINPIFENIESVNISKVRLKQIRWNLEPTSAQVTYELGEPDRIIAVGNALNERVVRNFSWEIRTTNMVQTGTQNPGNTVVVWSLNP